MPGTPPTLSRALVVAAALAALALFAWVGFGREMVPAPTPLADASEPALAAAEPAPAPAGERAVVTPPTPPPAPAAPSATTGGVQVQVVGDDDRGVAGIAVAMTFTVEGRPDENRIASARTDAAGHADLVADAETLGRLRMLGVTARFAVTAVVPLTDAPRAELGTSPTADAPILLRLPALGGATVRVLDHAGAPIDDGGDVFVFWRAPGSDGRWDRIGTPRAPSRGGTATFTALPLGQEVLFRASGTDRLQSGEVIVRGPVTPGENVTADLRLGLPWAFVTGSLVDEHGAPFVRPQVSMGIGLVAADAAPDALPARADTQMLWTKLDAGGRFRVRTTLAPPAGRRRALVVEHTDAGRETTRHAAIALPDQLASGADFDLGAIAFTAPTTERVLCAGRVVDAAGNGVGGVDVSAGHHDAKAGRWIALHQQRVRTAADGAFEVRSAQPAPDTFTLTASAQGRVPVQVAATAGSNHVLVLHEGGRLRARIESPEGVPAHLLVGTIVHPNGRSQEPNQFGGAFGADDLAPGRYDVVVRIAQSSWEVARVRGIAVRAGELADDPRVRRIDLSGRCRALALRLVDAEGKPLAQARLRLAAPDGRGSNPQTDRDGRVLAVVPLPTPPLRISMADGRHAEVHAAADELTVTLR